MLWILKGLIQKMVDENNEEIIDIYKNNKAIENRSKGLLYFINQFRQVWKIPELNIDKVKILPFLTEIKQLFFEEIKQKKINFILKVEPEDLNFQFDKKLIEQVIINLIKKETQIIFFFYKKKKKNLVNFYFNTGTPFIGGENLGFL